MSVTPALDSALARAIEELIDAKVAAALAERTPSPESTPWRTLPEAAEYLKVSPRTIARLVKQGRLRVSHVGRRVLVHTAERTLLLSQESSQEILTAAGTCWQSAPRQDVVTMRFDAC